jgi:hypothetical protein
VRKVSRDACAPVKCSGGTAILAIGWLDGDRCHARTLTETLRAASEAGWSHAVQHRFVNELFAGAVPDAVMARYLIQDHRFLDSFLVLLGAALASADTFAARLRFARFIGMVSGEENTYFLRAFEALGVPEARRSADTSTSRSSAPASAPPDSALRIRVAPPGWNSKRADRYYREERRKSGSQRTRRWRETDSNRRSLSCTHRPLVAEGNAVAIERGSLVIVVFLMRAQGIPLPPPVCPSASEIAARSPRITAARDGVAAAPGLSCQRASGQCDVGTVRPPDSPPLSPACGKQNSDTCFDQ